MIALVLNKLHVGNKVWTGSPGGRAGKMGGGSQLRGRPYFAKRFASFLAIEMRSIHEHLKDNKPGE